VSAPAVRHVLLLVQAALAGALAVLPAVLAFGLLRGRRRARGVAVAFELVLLVSGYLNAAVIGNDDLVSLLVTLGLPVALLCLLARYSPEVLPEPSEATG
jgi:hypothetical protein